MNGIGEYYRPSRQLDLTGLIVFIAFSLGVAPGIGAIYGLTHVSISGGLVKFILPLGFILAVSFVIGIGARMGKIRHPGVILLVGITGVLLAYHAHWMSWIWALSKGKFVFNPITLYSLIIQAAGKVTYGRSGMQFSAGVQYFLWALEFIVIIGAPAYVVSRFVSLNPFCDACDRWTNRKDSIQPLKEIAEPVAFRKAMENGDFSVLEQLGKVNYSMQVSSFVPVSEMEHSQVDVHFCSKCGVFHLLTVSHNRPIELARGHRIERAKRIVDQLIISPEQYKEIRKLDIVENSIRELVIEDGWLQKIKDLIGIS